MGRQFNFLFAVLANAPHEPLGTDQLNRGCNKKRLNAHVEQSRDGAWSIIGVECAQDKVAGQRGLNGNFGSFQVANFTHKNDVGILS